MDIMEQQIQCTSNLLQSGKPMGAGLLDKMAGSIISVLPVSCIGLAISAGGLGGLIAEITWIVGNLEVICK